MSYMIASLEAFKVIFNIKKKRKGKNKHRTKKEFKSFKINANQCVLLIIACGIVYPLVPLTAYGCQLHAFSSIQHTPKTMMGQANICKYFR